MAKEKKAKEEASKILYVKNVVHYKDKTFVPGIGYEMTKEEINAVSRITKVCDCPPEIKSKGDCNCGK